MNELTQKILTAKNEERQRLSTLPIEEKLEIMEKLRDMELAIRKPTTVTVAGGVVVGISGAQIVGLRPPAFHQSPNQSNTRQISKTLSAVLKKQPERWQIEPEPELERGSAFPLKAIQDFHLNPQKKS